MPSIPQSLLWISLVVLWLFVLVPMLVNKREAVRRTSDVALSTRVLTGANRLRGRRAGPAAGHRSDPDWQDSDAAFSDGHLPDDGDEFGELDEDLSEAPTEVFAAAGEVAGQAAFDFGDDAADDQIAESEEPGAAEDESVDDAVDDPADDSVDDARAVDTDGETAEEAAAADGAEPDAEAPAFGDDGEHRQAAQYQDSTPSGAMRRARYDMKTAAAVSARKYEFRKRMLLAMALVLVAATLVAFTVAPGAWWFSIVSAGAMVLYLSYLRRQTRIEERVRARRLERIDRARARAGMPPALDLEVVPDRLRQPGLAVLEVDDEDPAFEHLEYASALPDRAWRHDDLPRASGQ